MKLQNYSTEEMKELGTFLYIFGCELEHSQLEAVVRTGALIKERRSRKAAAAAEALEAGEEGEREQEQESGEDGKATTKRSEVQ